MKFYKAIPAFVYFDDQHGRMVEHKVPVTYRADTEKEAIQAAARFAEDRYINFFKDDELYPQSKIGSLKVYPIRIGYINQGGHIEPQSDFCIFEWKMDFPCTLDQKIEMIQGGRNEK